MNEQLQALIEATAAKTGIPSSRITLMFGLGEDNAYEWTATLIVFTGKPKKKTDPTPHRRFIGAGPDPAKALAEAAELHDDWKDPSIREKRQRRATLAEMAKDDPALTAQLRAKGLID